MMIGVILALIIVFYVMSKIRRMKARMREEQVTGKAYTSTGSSSQRYHDAQANRRYGSNSYSGPTAKRTYRSTPGSSTSGASSSSSSSSDVIEVPLLEVVDVSDEK